MLRIVERAGTLPKIRRHPFVYQAAWMYCPLPSRHILREGVWCKEASLVHHRYEFNFTTQTGDLSNKTCRCEQMLLNVNRTVRQPLPLILIQASATFWPRQPPWRPNRAVEARGKRTCPEVRPRGAHLLQKRALECNTRQQSEPISAWHLSLRACSFSSPGRTSSCQLEIPPRC